MRREQGEPFGGARAGGKGDGEVGIGQHHHGLVARFPAQYGEEFEYGVLGTDAHQDIDHGSPVCRVRRPVGEKARGRERDELRRSPPTGLDLSR
ncbi:hypothetical protein Sgou_58570 [Streptomyces gougerotii]|uniref:Uncharacterized protein n=1 Tax=Streptomyces gougerotii TaxID=53448 RepID=A0A8H9HM07_9ACTN|nr:hypothetical protein Srut_36270 [Streptomyces rutgersensis]GFH81187.1 hypothetical protein Sgou_58570 [Streptomyces gougerotii]GGU74448.1 hypothetical protein GCM10010227_30910 [Streptomyces gougerotii]